MCRNPLVAQDRRRTRKELLEATSRKLEKIKKSVDAGWLVKAEEIGLRVGKVIGKWKMAKHFELTIEEGRFEYRRKEEEIAREAELDGIYVIRTNVPAEKLSAELAVTAYKSLKEVEQDFGDMKSMMNIRPVHHRLEDRVRCHVFLCMLAQYVRWHTMQALEPLLAEEKHQSFATLMAHLGTIQRNTMEIEGQSFDVTTQSDELQKRMFAQLGLPTP